MKTRITRRNRIGAFLLVAYLMILAIGVLHVHECGENAFVCQDCMDHVKHNAHISQASGVDSDCDVCRIIGAERIAPEVLTLSAVVLLFAIMTTRTVRGILSRAVALPGLRAPPAMSCLGL